MFLALYSKLVILVKLKETMPLKNWQFVHNHQDYPRDFGAGVEGVVYFGSSDSNATTAPNECVSFVP